MTSRDSREIWLDSRIFDLRRVSFSSLSFDTLLSRSAIAFSKVEMRDSAYKIEAFLSSRRRLNASVPSIELSRLLPIFFGLPGLSRKILAVDLGCASLSSLLESSV